MKKLIIYFIFIFVLPLNVNAQPFKNKPVFKNSTAGKKVTFWDIQKEFNEHWKDKTPSEEESENAEEGGWQQFKRWEWFVEQRTYPSGEFPNPEILFTEFQKYKNTNSQNNKSSSVTNSNWAFIGPGVVPSGGGGAGRINCMTFDPANPSIIWVGAACGGVWKSMDGGITWSSNTDLLPSISISEIVIDPSNTQIMYLATGDKYGYIGGTQGFWGGQYSAGVLKSTDGGVTWNTTGLSYSLSNAKQIERLIIDPTNTNILYAATNIGILKTTDAGLTWNNIQSGSFYDIELNPSNSAILYAGNTAGIMRSTNSGTSWNTINGIFSSTRISIAVSPTNSNIVYAWSASGSFYYSSNAGVSFISRTDPSSFCSPNGYYDMVLEVSPANPNVISVGGLDIALSTDGGVSWSTVSDWSSWPSTNYCHADNHAHKFAPGSSSTLFSCNDGGIFKTTNQGNTWTDLSNGINIKQYYRLSSSGLSQNLIYAGAQDNGTDQITGINNATNVYSGDGEDCLIDYTNDNIVFASYQNGNFVKSADGGITFNTIGAGGCDWTSPLAMDPSNHNIMYSGGNDIFKSTDNGNTWNAVGATFDGNCLYSLEICNSQPNNIYTATFGHIYRSSNAGTSWNNITSNLPIGQSAITGIAVNGSNPNMIWVSFSGFSAGNKVYNTSNGGISWSNVSGTLPNIPVNCIEYQNGSNDLIYIGTDFGVFYKDASMSNWLPYNTGLPNVIIDELEISYAFGKLRAATYGRGLWESNLQTSVLQNLDASATTLVYPLANTCNTVIAPIVQIKNTGVTTITTVSLYYRIDSQPLQTFTWTGSLASLAINNIALANYTLTAGPHILKAYTSNPNSSTDLNALNDTIIVSFTISSGPAGSTPPLTQGFVSSVFPPTSWALENSSGIWWRTTTAGGFGNSSESALANFYNVSFGTDTLITPYVDFTNVLPPIRLYFDVAYAPYSSTYKDSLMVNLYTNCPDLSERLYAKGGSVLATAPTIGSYFTPTSNQWRTEALNLDSLAGHAPLAIHFVAKSDYGNNLYLDNINLTGMISPTGVKNLLQNDFYISVFPNPAGNLLNVEINSSSDGKITIEVFDMLGNIVQQWEDKAINGKNRMNIDVSSFSEGIYLLKIQENNSVTTKKITISH